MARSASPSPRRISPGLGATVLIAAAFVIGLLRLAGLVAENAVNVPAEDQWDTLGALFEGHGVGAAFVWQHGPHRQGLGGAVQALLYPATGWDVRAEAWAAVGVLALTAATALALAHRIRGRLAWRDAALPLLLLAPLHWETMLATPNLAHSLLPLALVLLLARVWLMAPGLRRHGAIGAVGLLAWFTGFGLCGAAAAVALAIGEFLRPVENGPRRAAAGTLVLLLGGLLLFAYGYRWDPAVPGWRFPVPQWWDYGRFAALIFTSVLGWREISLASTTAGGVMLGLTLAAFLGAAAAIARGPAAPRHRVVALLTGTSLAYATLTAVGRLPMSIEAAFMWRYTTLMLPALCGLCFAAEGWTDSRPVWLQRTAGVLALTLAAVIWSNTTPERYAAAIAASKRRWIAAYLQSRDLAMANRTSGYWVYYPAPESPKVGERLRWLEARRLSFFHDTPVEPPAGP